MIRLALFKNEIFVGGAEKQLITLANELDTEKFKVFIIAAKINNKLISRHIEIETLESKSYISQIAELFKFLKRNKIEICHCWDFRSSIIGLMATLLLPTKLIDGSIRSAPSELIIKNNIKFLMDIVKIKIFSFFKLPIVSNSNAGLISYKISNYTNSHVIFNSIDNRISKRLKHAKTGFNIGMLANMRFKKDFATLINAAPFVLNKHDDVIFYLMGDGPDKAKYESLVDKLDLKNKVVFTGFIHNTDEYISKMDICVLINDYTGEGLSNSIMEYMLYSKPVIATNMGGNNELVINRVTGFLIMEKDFIDLATKINYLLDNKDKIKEFGENGYNRISKFFSVQKMVNNYERLYTSLISN